MNGLVPDRQPGIISPTGDAAHTEFRYAVEL